MELSQKIENKKEIIGIIGLGYVGLPLVKEFSLSGVKVIGFDIDKKKIDLLNSNKSYIKHIPEEVILECSKNRFEATGNFSKLETVDIVFICVPTPLGKHREPDLSCIINTTNTITKYLRRNQLIVLKSTTYPGTTEDIVLPLLSKTKMKVGIDFFLAYSPEREDPGNKKYSTSDIPLIIGGCTKKCRDLTCAVYDKIGIKTIPVSSTRVAESAKLLENIYRSVNIALVNELKMIFDKMDINIFEVIEAAKSKPFGFHAFYPGPGLGGHCIPIDPFYLTWKAKEYDYNAKFIELAGEINTYMPGYVVEKVIKALNNSSKVIKNSKILLLGMAYKKNVDDLRESPSLKIMELLLGLGAIVDYSDPYIPELTKTREYNFSKKSISITIENLKKYDCVLIITDHDGFDKELILRNSKIIVDTRNMFGESFRNKNIFKA